jgi:hypothetical protein
LGVVGKRIFHGITFQALGSVALLGRIQLRRRWLLSFGGIQFWKPPKSQLSNFSPWLLQTWRWEIIQLSFTAPDEPKGEWGEGHPSILMPLQNKGQVGPNFLEAPGPHKLHFLPQLSDFSPWLLQTSETIQLSFTAPQTNQKESGGEVTHWSWCRFRTKDKLSQTSWRHFGLVVSGLWNQRFREFHQESVESQGWCRHFHFWGTHPGLKALPNDQPARSLWFVSKFPRQTTKKSSKSS